MEAIRIVYIDDQCLLHGMIQRAFECKENVCNSAEFIIVATAKNQQEATNAIHNEKADIAIMKQNAGGPSAFNMATQLLLNFPELKILLLTSDRSPENVRRSFDIGISGLISMDSSFNMLQEAIHVYNRIENISTRK